jgi:chromosome segregation ATPase
MISETVEKRLRSLEYQERQLSNTIDVQKGRVQTAMEQLDELDKQYRSIRGGIIELRNLLEIVKTKEAEVEDG